MDLAGSSRLFAVASAALFSTGGTVIKFTSLAGIQVAALRCAVGAAAIALFVPSSRRGFTWRVLPVAGAYALQSLLFATSNKLTTAANAIFLQSTAPLYVLLLAPWLLKERVRLRDVLFLAALGSGLALIFLGEDVVSATAPRPVLGNVLAAASAVGWALTIVGLRWLGRIDPTGGAGMQAALLGNALAFAVAAPWTFPVRGLDAKDVAAIAYLGVIQIGLAYWCLTRAARGVAAVQLSLLILVEPVLSAVWAWGVHGERPAPLSLAGMAVILAATAAQAVRRE